MRLVRSLCCCLYIRLCLSICLYPLLFYRRLRLINHLAICQSVCLSPSHNFCYEAYEITLLSLSPNCVVFCAVHVVSKESRRLVLPRTFC
jgi:hypothetical protein